MCRPDDFPPFVDSPVDKSPDFVDNQNGAPTEPRPPSPAPLPLAQNADLPRLGKLEARPPKPSAFEPSRSLRSYGPTQSHLSERLLFKGYAVDIDDIEGERIERR